MNRILQSAIRENTHLLGDAKSTKQKVSGNQKRIMNKKLIKWIKYKP